MITRRSFLVSAGAGAVAAPALAFSGAQGPRISNASDPLVQHMLKESTRAYRHLQSGNTAREVQGLRALAANTRLMQAHGSTLDLRTKAITAQRYLKDHPQQAKAQAAAYVRQAEAELKRLKLTGTVGDPLAFSTVYPRAILDLDKLLLVTSRAFDTAAAYREQPLKSAAMRLQQPDTISMCISNVDEGGCEVHQNEICDTYSLLKMMMQASTIFFGAMCGACEGLVLLFQIDTLAISIMGYWNGC